MFMAMYRSIEDFPRESKSLYFLDITVNAKITGIKVNVQ